LEDGVSTWEFPLMRDAGQKLSEIAVVLHEMVVPGVTPLDLDQRAEAEIRTRGCRPAFKGYRGYPNTLCVSVNDCIIHGIPDGRPFEQGDVISVDMGLVDRGYFADMAFTVVLGENQASWMLKRAAEDALVAGIRAARPGNRIGDIGAAIQAVAQSRGLGIIHEFAGHGIGRKLHEHPLVPNVGMMGKGQLIQPGMALAIEPMFTLGGWQTKTLDDGWTVKTMDGSLAAHAEHTVLITEDGPEILTF
jgi:methionyl aminopeptidase